MLMRARAGSAVAGLVASGLLVLASTGWLLFSPAGFPSRRVPLSLRLTFFLPRQLVPSLRRTCFLPRQVVSSLRSTFLLPGKVISSLRPTFGRGSGPMRTGASEVRAGEGAR